MAIFVLANSAFTVCAEETTEEWQDEENREEAWMTYLLTDWPIKELRVSYSGINFIDNEVYSEEYDLLYTPLIEEMLDSIEGTDLANQCMYQPLDYLEIMKFVCAYESYLVKNKVSQMDGWLYKDASSSGVFALTEGVYETKEENGRKYLHYPLSNPVLWHDENDIGYVKILLNKNFTIPSSLNEHEAKIYSLKTLFKTLISKEEDGMSIIGDIYNSDDKLAGMLLRMYCPQYNYGEYSPDNFQDHMVALCSDASNVDKIKNGTLYPWIYNMGFVQDAVEQGFDGVAWSSSAWGGNFGDNDLDGAVDYYWGGYVNAAGESRDYIDDDPTYITAVRAHYTGCQISYTFDDYEKWGNHIDFGDFSNLTEGEGTGAEIAEYAQQFVGNPYVWGGSSLTNGTDCSGFTMALYAEYGISLPHSASGQSHYGTEVSIGEDTLQAGDLIFYGSNPMSIEHVAMYIGNGQVVHASNQRDGIKISPYNYRTPVKAVRLL